MLLCCSYVALIRRGHECPAVKVFAWVLPTDRILQLAFLHVSALGDSCQGQRKESPPFSYTRLPQRSCSRSWLMLYPVFWIVFTFYIVFSSIQNKVNQPEINAYCYAIETASQLYYALQLIHNSLIIFVLDSYKLNQSLAQQANKIMASNR